MKKIILIMGIMIIMALSATAGGKNLYYHFSDGTTQINATDVCLSTGACLSQAGGSYDLDVAGDSGTGSITNAETMSIIGSANIQTAMNGNILTVEYNGTIGSGSSNCSGANCDIGWGNITSIPADIADGDDDTTYIGSSNISIVGNVISFNGTISASYDDSDIRQSILNNRSDVNSIGNWTADKGSYATTSYVQSTNTSMLQTVTDFGYATTAYVILTNSSLLQYVTDQSYISDGNTNWDNSYGFITTVNNLSMQDINDSNGNLTQWLTTVPNLDTDSTDDATINYVDLANASMKTYADENDDNTWNSTSDIQAVVSASYIYSTAPQTNRSDADITGLCYNTEGELTADLDDNYASFAYVQSTNASMLQTVIDYDYATQTYVNLANASMKAYHDANGASPDYAKVQNYSNNECPADYYVYDRLQNGTWLCRADQSGAGSYDWNYTADQGGVGIITDSELFTFEGNGSIKTFVENNKLVIEGTDTTGLGSENCSVSGSCETILYNDDWNISSYSYATTSYVDSTNVSVTAYIDSTHFLNTSKEQDSICTWSGNVIMCNSNDITEFATESYVQLTNSSLLQYIIDQSYTTEAYVNLANASMKAYADENDDNTWNSSSDIQAVITSTYIYTNAPQTNRTDADIQGVITQAYLESINFNTTADIKAWVDFNDDVGSGGSNCSVSGSCETILYNDDWNISSYNYITDGNTNWDNSYGFITSVINFSGSYNDLSDKPANIDEDSTDDATITYVGLVNNSMKEYVDEQAGYDDSSVRQSIINNRTDVSTIGNWTADKGSYATTTYVDTTNTSVYQSVLDNQYLSNTSSANLLNLFVGTVGSALMITSNQIYPEGANTDVLISAGSSTGELLLKGGSATGGTVRITDSGNSNMVKVDTDVGTVEITKGGLNASQNITTPSIYLANDVSNHKIYDNGTCIIITGDTSEFAVC